MNPAPSSIVPCVANSVQEPATMPYVANSKPENQAELAVPTPPALPASIAPYVTPYAVSSAPVIALPAPPASVSSTGAYVPPEYYCHA